MKCCENCRFAIYDSVPYGSTSADMLSGCEKEDYMTGERIDQMTSEGYCDLYEEIEEQEEYYYEEDSEQN